MKHNLVQLGYGPTKYACDNAPAIDLIGSSDNELVENISVLDTSTVDEHYFVTTRIFLKRE